MSFSKQTIDNLTTILLNQGAPHRDICFENGIPLIPYGYTDPKSDDEKLTLNIKEN